MKFTHILYIFLSFFILNSTSLQAQNESKYPQEYFRSPINGRIYLSGTFGELRSNHFHAGIDIKTGGSERKNVYASAEGWISRVKISPWGYGNAIYIEHPNGYTTVYGHLKEIKGALAEYVLKQQYKKQNFTVDLYLTAHQFAVNQGDIIALSGNSGSSGGPHVHFEIRETATQEPLNPLLFGIKVKDLITPIIKSLRIYPAEKGALIQGKNKAENFILKGWGRDYHLKNGDSIHINGDFYLGIYTIDKQNDSHNKNGVYQIEVFLDSVLFYSHHVERLNFSTSRYINTLIDYNYYKNGQRRYQRTFQSPNNKLAIYDIIQNDGVLSLNDQQYHMIQYVVKDIEGNSSILEFTIFSDTAITQKHLTTTNSFNPLTKNQYQDKYIDIQLPNSCLYDTMTFTTNIEAKHKHSLSPIYTIGDESIALQKNIQVKLKDLNIADSLRNQVYIGRITKKSIGAIHATWKKNDLSFKTKYFGNYSVFIDTVPPSITVKTKLDQINKTKKIEFIVKDLESGIAQYNAWLNGSWALLQWDPKKSKMTYHFPPDNASININSNEKSIFKIIITDEVGNRIQKIITY